jgi:hypothetical protein
VHRSLLEQPLHPLIDLARIPAGECLHRDELNETASECKWECANVWMGRKVDEGRAKHARRCC